MHLPEPEVCLARRRFTPRFADRIRAQRASAEESLMVYACGLSTRAHSLIFMREPAGSIGNTVAFLWWESFMM
jgi:hypothetical protein